MSEQAKGGSDPTRTDSILEAAEVVFARNGYDAATMRQVAAAAGVGVSLIVYHFETKLGLYRAVFERRQYVNDRRLALLGGVAGAQGREAISRWVSAFAEPVLDLHENEHDIWYARLVLREAADPSNSGRHIIADLFDPMANQFIDSLSGLFPGVGRDQLAWAYLFCVGVLTQSSFDDRTENLGGGVLRVAKRTTLLRYLQGGLEGLNAEKA